MFKKVAFIRNNQGSTKADILDKTTAKYYTTIETKLSKSTKKNDDDLRTRPTLSKVQDNFKVYKDLVTNIDIAGKS